LNVTAAYFDILGARAELGRTVVAGDDQPGRDHVVVLSHKLWVSQFGADPGLIGQPIRLNGDSYTVVGVMPANSPFDRSLNQLWISLAFPPERMTRANHWLVSVTGGAVGLLKPGITVAQARAELDSVAARIARDHPETNSGWGVIVEPYGRVGVALKQLLTLLLTAVGLVLLIGCVNLANVMLARGLARERDVAIRMALGAGRRRLISQFLTESLVLSLAGGMLGLGVANAMVAVLKTTLFDQPLSPSFPSYLLPPEATISIDGSVLLFTFLVSVLSGVGFGLVPALRNTRATTDASLHLARQTSVHASHRGFQRALIVAELALAFVLLSSASLLVRSLIKIANADTGFTGTNVLTASLPIWEHRFPNDDALRAYLRRLTDAIAPIPGVRDVAFTDGLPLQGAQTGRGFQIVGQPVVDFARQPTCDFKTVSPAYFRAMALRVRSGRELREEDREGAPYVAVINETMARLYFSRAAPVGQHVLTKDMVPGTTQEISWTIVGVIADERLTPFDDPRERPALYVSIDQKPTGFAGLVVRTAGDPGSLREPIRRAIAGADKDLAVTNVRTVGQIEVDAMAPDRVRTWSLGILATVGLLLSAVGVYGMFAYIVVQRTRELGIRSALGARSRDLVWLIVREGMVLSAVGICVGLVGAVSVARLLRSFLFGVAAIDPIAITTAAVTLGTVAAIACYLPARRATIVDPIAALRME
jgi:putative ABC transport system permease protein